MEYILSVKNLRTDFADGSQIVHAVNDVSFDIREGETFGLIGESGCGKSATCRSIIGLLKENGKIAGGQVLYRGRDITHLRFKEMQKIRGHEIGMIFQEPMTTLNPVVKIGVQLTESLSGDMSKEDKKKRAAELLKLVGISDAKQRLEAYPHQLSGGMRQRVMIAIALAAGPKLLLADEPTTALDVTIQDQVLKLLMKLKQELKMSMILVTHDLGVAAQTCDHIAVMYAGQIVEKAPVKTIFKSPRNPYTDGLMCSLPSSVKKGSKLLQIEGTPPNLKAMPEGCPFAPRCRYCEDICHKKMPELEEIGPEHLTRCHFWKKLENVQSVVEGDS